MQIRSSKIRVLTLQELDALVGSFVTGEEPVRHWEDSQGCFRFETEDEARQAMQDPYYQNFLPEVDWTQTQILLISEYRAYSTDYPIAWEMIERFVLGNDPIVVQKERGFWNVTLKNQKPARARTIPVALCLAALLTRGVEVELEHDRIDHKLNNGAPPQLPTFS
jgi:hypothetical protein